MRRWHAAHKDEQNAKRRQWHAEHRDESNAGRRARYFSDHEQTKVHNRMLRAQARLAAPSITLLRNAAKRSKDRNIAFNLTEAWLAERWTGRCELTGIEFRITAGLRRSCFSPSLDKIDPKGGYTTDNCRLILWGINAMKGEDSDADVLEIAKAIVENSSTFSVG